MQEWLVASEQPCPPEQNGQTGFRTTAASLSDEDGNTDHHHVTLLPSTTTTKDFQ